MLDAVRTSHMTTPRSTWATHCLMTVFITLAAVIMLAVAESRADARPAAVAFTDTAPMPVAALPTGRAQALGLRDDNRKEAGHAKSSNRGTTTRRTSGPGLRWIGGWHATPTL